MSEPTIHEWLEEWTKSTDSDDQPCDVSLGDLRRWAAGETYQTEEIERMTHGLLDVQRALELGDTAMAKIALEACLYFDPEAHRELSDGTPLPQ